VAASAIAGKIADPATFSKSFEHASYTESPRISIISTQTSKKPTVTEVKPVISGFPESIKAELLFCHADNLNTDAIYPGKYTYVDDLTPDQMAKVVMENYDPKFVNLVQQVSPEIVDNIVLKP